MVRGEILTNHGKGRGTLWHKMHCFPKNDSVGFREKLISQILHDAEYKPLHRVCSMHFEDLFPNAPVTPQSPYVAVRGRTAAYGAWGSPVRRCTNFVSTGTVEFWCMHNFSSRTAYWLRYRKITKQPLRYGFRTTPERYPSRHTQQRTG